MCVLTVLFQKAQPLPLLFTIQPISPRVYSPRASHWVCWEPFHPQGCLQHPLGPECPPIRPLGPGMLEPAPCRLLSHSLLSPDFIKHKWMEKALWGKALSHIFSNPSSSFSKPVPPSSTPQLPPSTPTTYDALVDEICQGEGSP